MKLVRGEPRLLEFLREITNKKHSSCLLYTSDAADEEDV